MENEIFQAISKHLGVWEAFLVLALCRCLVEIRSLYRGQLTEKEKVCQALEEELAFYREKDPSRDKRNRSIT
jgi:hypothetical protein